MCGEPKTRRRPPLIALLFEYVSLERVDTGGGTLAELGDPDMLHGRFLTQDRDLLDRARGKRLGSEAKNSDTGAPGAPPLSNRPQMKDRALYLICGLTYHYISARCTGHYEDESCETVFDIPG